MVDVVTKLKIAIPLLSYLAKTKPTQNTTKSGVKTNLVREDVKRDKISNAYRLSAAT